MAKARQARKEAPAAAAGVASDAHARPFESEEVFRAVVVQANEGILIYDKNLNIIAGNQAAERILGLSLAQLIGKPGFTSQLPCVRADGTPLAADERPTMLTRRSGAPLTDLVIGIQRPDGSLTWISVNTAFLR